jgi:hypothetical protein
MPADDADGYAGPARLRTGGRDLDVIVTIRGYFEPIDGRYHWRGRIAANDELSAALGGRAAAGTLTIGRLSAECALTEPDPWGRYRVSGESTPPFPTALSGPDDAALGQIEQAPGHRPRC